MVDFLAAATLFEDSAPPEVILGWLLPWGMEETRVGERVHVLVALGSVLAGTAATGHPDQVWAGSERSDALATEFMDAGGRLDTTRIQDLIAANGAGFTLTDVMIELLSRFVTLDGVRS